MYLLPFPILGAVLAWTTVYFTGFRRQRWAEFLLGFAAFFIAMLVQNPVQQLPLLGIGIRSNADIVSRGTVFILAVSLWFGLVAGIVQEGVKYYLVREKKLREALFVGLGFGVTEAVIVTLATVIPLALNGTTLDVPLISAIVSLAERYFATLFHVGTAVFLAHAFRSSFGRRGLLYMIALHTVMDTGAAYLQLISFIRIGPQLMNLWGYLFEVAVAVVGVAIFVYGSLKALSEPEEEEKPLW